MAATKSFSAIIAQSSEWGTVTFLERIHASGVRIRFSDYSIAYTSDVVLVDWTIRELALYDLPALVDWVCLATGYDKIAFIGHSQGNGVGFLSLSLGHRPELGNKLSCFIALAPAVFAGPLTRGFPFTVLSKVKWKTWQRVFGVQDFIPLMRYSYDYVPPLVFSTMGYTMFAFLFEWTDTNW
jgi:lysosomal acid lipase/cholesteryl ester hydrolase